MQLEWSRGRGELENSKDQYVQKSVCIVRDYQSFLMAYNDKYVER